MKIKKLWQKLSSTRTQEEEIALHVSGATVIHKNPFGDLKVHRNDDELTREFAAEWISPYYMTLLHTPRQEDINTFTNDAGKFTLESTKKLLGYFDWRSKITGSYFAAINNYKELEDDIGNLLLKSEVCYAGEGYCLALAIFGTNKSKNYLKQYLEYYLLQNDLWFDQSQALCALEYIDEKEAEFFLPAWNEFIVNKPNWDLERSRKNFSNSIQSILTIRKLTNHRL